MRKEIIVVLLIFLLGFFFWQKSRLPWTRTNLVFSGKALAVFSLEPQKNLTVFQFPDNLYLEVPGGFGYYQAASVYELGKLEKRGGELLKATFQDYLAVPMDGYLKISNPPSWLPLCQVGDFLDGQEMASCFLLFLLGRLETDLSWGQLIRLWWQTQQLRSDKIKTVKLKDTAVLSLAELPDGSQVFRTQSFSLDQLIGKYFNDRDLSKEKLKIEIFNATTKLGLAKKFSRMITNLGGEVISISNTENNQENSSIKCLDSSIKNKYTVQRLEAILETKATVETISGSRGQVVIFIGQDYH